MSISQQPLGDIFNVIASASGIPIPLRDYGGVAFVTFEADGSTIATLTQHTTSAGSPGTESALSVTNAAWKAPGVGGTWSAGPTPSAGVYDLADDATNDSMALFVRSDQLSDDNDWVECTVDGGICIAILFDLDHRMSPDKLLSNIAL